MKTLCRPDKFLFAPILLLLLFFAGCATPGIDWDRRIGAYTYDQAVLELGPPDKLATLTDGTVVAEWLTHRGYPRGGFISGHPQGMWLHHYPEPPAPHRFLRLTFAPEGTMVHWRRVIQ
jgi:hypothetical protein